MNDNEIERVKSYLLFVFQPHNLFTSSFHKETDLNTRTFLHNEVCRIYSCKRDVVESVVKKTDESYKRKYGIFASCDPYSDFNEIYDIFTNLMREADREEKS